MTQSWTNPWRSRRVILLLALGAAVLLGLSQTRLAAAEPKPADKAAESKKGPLGSPSLDDALLDDLDNELLDGAGDLKDRTRKKPADPAGPDKPADRATIDGEDVGMAGEDDPLAYIGQEMQELESTIPQSARRIRTEHLQQRVIEDLSKLIEQAQQQQQAAQQSASQKDQKQKTGKRQTVKQSKPNSAGTRARIRTSRPATAPTAWARPKMPVRIPSWSKG